MKNAPGLMTRQRRQVRALLGGGLTLLACIRYYKAI